MYGTPEEMAQSMLNAAKFAIERKHPLTNYVPATRVVIEALSDGKSEEEAKTVGLKYIEEHNGVI